MIPKGSGNCTSDYDCIDSVCHNTTCSDYLSLKTGTDLGVGEYFEANLTFHCESGTWAYNSTGNGAICVDAFESDNATPYICTSDADCTGFNTQIMTATSYCDCGYNADGNSYCSPFM
jgi:hypothetical protein